MRQWGVLGDYFGPPVVAPDGTLFAVDYDQLVRIHPDGHRKVLFTADRAMTSSPAWDPDGSVVLTPESGTVSKVAFDGPSSGHTRPAST